MVKVGITGGIGSGKTKVCKIWQSLGAYIINADGIAKDLMVHNEAIKDEIIDTFGESSYHSDGSLNRTYLAKQAFEKGRVKELNAIVHPHVPSEVEALMQTAEEHGYKVVVYEAALLLQNLRPAFLDEIVLVLADQEKRIARVTKRDNVGKQDVLDRIHKQQDFNELKDKADVIIQNNGSLDELNRRAKEIYNRLVSAYSR